MTRWQDIPGFVRGRHVTQSDEEPDSAPLWREIIPYIRGKLEIHVAEVGCYYGRTTRWLLEECAQYPLIVHAVDQWMAPVDWMTGDYGDGAKSILPDFDRNMGAYSDQVVRYAMGSVGAAKALNYGQLDAAYIDGAHGYEQVVADLEAWIPIVRPGGFLCGDDYSLPTVKRAVDEVLVEAGLEVHSIGPWPQWFAPIP
jgi:SAM-dependent methyltransferase